MAVAVVVMEVECAAFLEHWLVAVVASEAAEPSDTIAFAAALEQAVEIAGGSWVC